MSKNNTQDNGQKVIPLVVAYNPLLFQLRKKIRKYLFFLYIDYEVKRLFTVALSVFFCNAMTFRNHLLRTKLYLAEERLIRSRKCLGNRCQVFKLVAETGTFQVIVEKIHCKHFYEKKHFIRSSINSLLEKSRNFVILQNLLILLLYTLVNLN